MPSLPEQLDSHPQMVPTARTKAKRTPDPRDIASGSGPAPPTSRMVRRLAAAQKSEAASRKRLLKRRQLKARLLQLINPSAAATATNDNPATAPDVQPPAERIPHLHAKREASQQALEATRPLVKAAVDRLLGIVESTHAHERDLTGSRQSNKQLVNKAHELEQLGIPLSEADAILTAELLPSVIRKQAAVFEERVNTELPSAVASARAEREIAFKAAQALAADLKQHTDALAHIQAQLEEAQQELDDLDRAPTPAAGKLLQHLRDALASARAGLAAISASALGATPMLASLATTARMPSPPAAEAPAPVPVPAASEPAVQAPAATLPSIMPLVPGQPDWMAAMQSMLQTAVDEAVTRAIKMGEPHSVAHARAPVHSAVMRPSASPAAHADATRTCAAAPNPALRSALPTAPATYPFRPLVPGTAGGPLLPPQPPPSLPPPPPQPQPRPHQWESDPLEDEPAVQLVDAEEVGAGQRGGVRIPKPPLFSGSESQRWDDYYYVFENYLLGNNIARHQWVAHATAFLTDRALTAWTAASTQARRASTPITWDLFVTTLSCAFTHSDRALEARKQLHTLRQTRGLHAFVRHFKLLVSQCSTAPSQHDLVLFFFNGLSPQLQSMCRSDPRTGSFWDTVDALINHAIVVHASAGTSVRVPVARVQAMRFKRTRARQPQRSRSNSDERAPKEQQRDHTRGRGPHGGGYRGGRGYARGRGGPGPNTRSFERGRDGYGHQQRDPSPHNRHQQHAGQPQHAGPKPRV